jgi:ribosomal-protein-alanine N-acetyltransferase
MTPDPPTLQADGLLLGPWRDEDAPQVVALAHDPTTRQWSPSLRPVRTEADARAWIEGRRGTARVDWAVREPETGELIGRVGLHHFDEDSRSGEIGYGVLPSRRRRGIARRAVEVAVRHGFEQLGLARISLIHAVDNPASCAVAVRSGFAYEGIERQALDHGDGVLHDIHRHARLATDPPGPAPGAPPPLRPVTVAAGELLLRPWRPDDAREVLRALTDPSISRWSPRAQVADLDAARRWVAVRAARWVEGAAAFWAVVSADDQLLGSVGLREVNTVDAFAVASYWVMPESRGRGVATTALRAATAHGFAELGLHRVQLAHALGNRASCRVAEKSGFALEGVLRGSSLLPEGWSDEHLHARLTTDPT